MHVVLLTLMTLSGADPVAVQQASGAVTYPSGAYSSACSSCGSSACNGSACGHGNSHYDRKINRQLQRYMSGRRSGPMPQTCYSPRFGCYHGNDRHMNRYPAFHGTYYRRPYNYRNLFEYPWHAEMHEPTSYFSYNVPPEQTNGGSMPPQQFNAPPVQDAPPMLPPGAAAGRQAPRPSAQQPVFAPAGGRSAGMESRQGIEHVQYLPPPRLSDQDLAGVDTQLQIEDQRVAPAPIESTADATPYQEEQTAASPAPAFAPRVSARSISSEPVMLRPLSPKQKAHQSQEVKPAEVAPQKIEAKPISARRQSSENIPEPQVAAKRITLGQPKSIELKPLTPTSQVTQAKAEEEPSASSKVQPTSATAPVEKSNALRADSVSPSSINPLRR